MAVSKKEFELEEDNARDETFELKVLSQDEDDAYSYHNYPEDGFEDQFTWRAALLGSLLGCIISASNLYMELHIGISFSASLFGALLGFAGLKLISKLPLHMGGGGFGMKENCTAQSAATGACSMSAGFGTGIPALYWLNLLPPPEECWGMFVLWVAAASFLGVFYGVAVRNYFIIQEKLVFPMCSAAALSIRALHSGNDNDSNMQTKWAVCSFVLSLLYKSAAYFAPVLTELRIFYWLSQASGSLILQEIDSYWKWKIQLSTAFFGTGILVGMNSAVSFMVGSLLAWGMIGPILLHTDSDVNKDYNGGKGTTIRFWNLWVGVTILLCASFTQLVFQYKSIFKGVRGCFILLYNPLARRFRFKKFESKKEIQGPIREEDQVPTWQWVIGLVLSYILSILVLKYYFEMRPELGLLSCLLASLFAFIGIQSFGESSFNPAGGFSRVSQLSFAATNEPSLHVLQTTNIVSGILTNIACNVSGNIVGNFKAAYMLKASPKSQLHAQLVGSLIGLVFCVVIFQLFAKAYPCILINPEEGSFCQFNLPVPAQYMAVTKAITGNIDEAISLSCRYACLGFGLLTIFSTILKNTLFKKQAPYFINWTLAGLAFIMPAPHIPIAFLVGALFASFMKNSHSKLWNLISNALVSGLIAGEGIGGIVQAIFVILGLPQSKVATGFACPQNNPYKC